MRNPLDPTLLPFSYDIYMTSMPGGGYPKRHIAPVADLTPEQRGVSAKRGARVIGAGEALCMKRHKRRLEAGPETGWCWGCEWEARNIIRQMASRP